MSSDGQAKNEILNVMKEALEGSLAFQAYSNGSTQETGFSRSGGTGHSKSGHDFSRAQILDGVARSPEISEEANIAFARAFLSSN